MRASKVAGCGLPKGIAIGPQGSILRSRAGVPTATVVRCGSRLCASCARDVARRQRRRILDRLEELQAREGLVGPVRTAPRRGRGAPVAEILAAVADHGEAAELAAAALERRYHELRWQGLDEDEAEDQAEDEARAVAPVLKLPTRARDPRPMARTVQMAASTKERAARLVVPLERLVPLALAAGASERARAQLVHELVRVPRLQRRPPSDCAVEIVPLLDAAEGDGDGRSLLRAVRSGRPARRTDASFRVGLPPRRNAYGCRFLTLTQPARPAETLCDALDRLEDALERLQRSHVWKAYVDGAVIRIEFELSTPERRRARAAELAAEGRHGEAAAMRASSATWWHVHAHVLVWGRRWPQRTACLARDAHGPIFWAHTRKGERVPCSCTRCSGVDDESSLLATWRRALVETRRYAPELAGVEFCEVEMAGPRRAVLVEAGEAAVLDRLRRYSHRATRTWARALVDVKIGGAHIKTPSRVRAGERLESPWAALCEVVKYSTKAVALGSMPLDRVVEVIRATDRRRLVRSTGILFSIEIEDDRDDEPRVEGEGVDREAGIGPHALDDAGRVVDSDEFVWVKPHEERFAELLEERRRLLEQLHDFYERRREIRRAEREATGPPDRGRQRVQRPHFDA